ncbi:MAG: hypothetical protein WDO73_28595 [Ignavibacteriota bacterium]
MAATKSNPLLRFGLAIGATGALALILLLAYNHGLEDTLPFVLYLICWTTIPLALLLCLAGIGYNLFRSRSR